MKTGEKKHLVFVKGFKSYFIEEDMPCRLTA